MEVKNLKMKYESKIRPMRFVKQIIMYSILKKFGGGMLRSMVFSALGRYSMFQYPNQDTY